MPYIGRSTEAFGVRTRYTYTPSAGDTSVSGADVNGLSLSFTDGAYVDVFLNGVRLKHNTDYVTTTANSAFSFSNSFTAGDASTATGTNATTYTAGAAGTAAPGLITNAHTVTLAGGTAGSGSGSTVTGQFVSEVTIFD